MNKNRCQSPPTMNAVSSVLSIVQLFSQADLFGWWACKILESDNFKDPEPSNTIPTEVFL